MNPTPSHVPYPPKAGTIDATLASLSEWAEWAKIRQHAVLLTLLAAKRDIELVKNQRDELMEAAKTVIYRLGPHNLFGPLILSELEEAIAKARGTTKEGQ